MAGKRICVRGSEFVAGDRAIFLNGVNTPWDNWNDIGGDFNESFWRAHFAVLRENGINACVCGYPATAMCDSLSTLKDL